MGPCHPAGEQLHPRRSGRAGGDQRNGPRMERTALHEFGHSLGLADEYETWFGCPGTTETSYFHHSSTEPGEPNVTTKTERSQNQVALSHPADDQGPDHQERGLHEMRHAARPNAPGLDRPVRGSALASLRCLPTHIRLPDAVADTRPRISARCAQTDSAAQSRRTSAA